MTIRVEAQNAMQAFGTKWGGSDAKVGSFNYGMGGTPKPDLVRDLTGLLATLADDEFAFLCKHHLSSTSANRYLHDKYPALFADFDNGKGIVAWANDGRAGIHSIYSSGYDACGWRIFLSRRCR